MRKTRRWSILGALLLVLAAATVGAADREERGRYARPAAATESKWSWMNPTRWFGANDKPKAGDAKKKVSTKSVVDRSETVAPPSAADEARARRAREEADFLRRLSVCQQLREIALRGEDQAMLRRVEELEERAFAIYNQRSGARTPVIGTDLDTDLHKLDNLRDAEAAFRTRPDNAPVYSVTTGGTDRRDGVKEVDR